jgi:hypothetical protein
LDYLRCCGRVILRLILRGGKIAERFEKPGPWRWRIDWGDGLVTATATPVALSGEFAFVRRTPYTTPSPHTITATATDPTGATSRPVTTTAP